MNATTNASPSADSSSLETKPARCAVILNLQSGTLSELWSERFEAELLEALKANGWSPELHLVQGDEIQATVDRAIQSQCDAIIAGGGDGTTTSIANQLRNTKTPLGILPCGTLNLAARDLGAPLDPLETVRSLHPGEFRDIDVLEINGWTCLCLTIIGVYPELLNRADEFHGSKWWMKFFRLSGQLATAYFRSPRYRIKIKTESGGEKNVSTRLLLIVPGEYEDEFGLLPSREGLSSGKCRLYISNHQSRWSNVKMAFRFLTGHTKQDPDMLMESASSMEISVKGKRSTKVSIDGELMDLKLPAQFDLKRQALRVLVPKPQDTPNP
ncbi:diacylglycerol kinase family protein [Pelagicoccus sp. SDUM812003]|uniref:diacylglycerol/lipid kinase family protein n=1 Tax=Pelagicoccus sp. SDUM812003 TaxID=3041267 RepID=UPI00280F4488|nr:diacylglycerol kinase family protein [Pelagicoccus sp. SDUM812003]MDQ8203396.1 diacylglycerol kinase family protein [Pelagicoccus sp. SDUM812003]